MTITSALPRSLRSKFLLAEAVFALASGSAAHAAAMPQAHAPVVESSLALNSAPLKQLAPLFPASGLIAAAWATHHVRRRNARRLAATR